MAFYLHQYGAVKEVRMAVDKNGNSKGFAFVEFEREVWLSLC
jgi:RNA recognition motif-containing protein